MRDANLSLSSGVAHNAFHVILPAGDPRPAAVRAGEVQAKIQALQASTLRAGDAMPLLSEDGSSRIPRLSHPAAPEHAAPGAAPAPALANGAAHGAANGANAHGLHGGDGGANVALPRSLGLS